jgi:hypothetical protein
VGYDTYGICRGCQEDKDIPQEIEYSVARVKYTETQQTKKQVKKIKPNKKEYKVRIQLAQGTPP